MKRFLCIHGHFYQPPRENPWLEEVEIQDSAYPYHDWNQRITAECYSNNSASRILDEEMRITDIVSNYAKISFDMGPTLLQWLQKNSPATYNAIIEADKLAREESARARRLRRDDPPGPLRLCGGRCADRGLSPGDGQDRGATLGRGPGAGLRAGVQRAWRARSEQRALRVSHESRRRRG